MQDNAAATIDVTEQNVQQLLEHSRQVPVLFGFWASWSQPSQQMTVMLESGLDLKPIITHRFDFADFEEGFATALGGNSGKVILEW